MQNNELEEAKKAYDLEIKENNVPTAVSAYVSVLEEECKKYKNWWYSVVTEKSELDTLVEELRAEVSHYRTVIAHEFNRNK